MIYINFIFKVSTDIEVDKINRLDEIHGQVSTLAEDRDQIWQAYIDTQIVQKSNDVAWTGQDAITLPWVPPIHIITACNPFGKVLADDENQKRNSSLQEILNARNLKYESVIGKSTKGLWQEISFAIHGLSRAQACEIASRFEQRAIFEIDNEELHVISANDIVLQRSKKRME